jgi:hypothetical protein
VTRSVLILGSACAPRARLRRRRMGSCAEANSNCGGNKGQLAKHHASLCEREGAI